MVVNVRANLDFLDVGDLLLLACFVLAFLLFVTEFTVIKHLTDRWISLSGDLDQIHACLISAAHCFFYIDDTNHFTVGINQTDLGIVDHIIDPRAVMARRGFI